jgi:hypothetical protein
MSAKVNFTDGFNPVSLEIYQDKIYLMGTDGNMKVLDSNYNVIQKYQFSDNALEKYSERELSFLRQCCRVQNFMLSIDSCRNSRIIRCQLQFMYMT